MALGVDGTFFYSMLSSNCEAFPIGNPIMYIVRIHGSSARSEVVDNDLSVAGVQPFRHNQDRGELRTKLWDCRYDLGNEPETQAVHGSPDVGAKGLRVGWDTQMQWNHLGLMVW